MGIDYDSHGLWLLSFVEKRRCRCSNVFYPSWNPEPRLQLHNTTVEPTILFKYIYFLPHPGNNTNKRTITYTETKYLLDVFEHFVLFTVES